MPAPDISYYLEGSRELNFLASDAYGYFMHIHPNPDAFIDGMNVERYHMGTFRRHWNSLQAGALRCEEEFLRWRGERPREALAASFWAYEGIPYQLEHFVEAHSHLLVDAGFDRITDLGMQLCEQRYGYSMQMGVLKRQCRRAFHDLAGFEGAALDEGRRVCDTIWDSRRSQRQRALQEVSDYLTGLQYEVDLLPPGRAEEILMGNPRMADAYIKRGQRQKRKAVVRAIKFAERLLGSEPTRLFINGTSLRVEGQFAVYELTRGTSGLGMNQGSARLGVYAKEGDIQLCNLCIHTNGVPLMDHVASMVMHVQAGEEERILEIGNAFNVKREAYDQPWLVPFLPKKESLFPAETPKVSVPRSINTGLPKIPRLRYDARTVALSKDERRQRILAMNGLILDRLLNDLGPVMPAIPETMTMLRSGRMVPGSRYEEAVMLDLPSDTLDDPVGWAEVRAEARTAIHLLAENPNIIEQALAAGVIGPEDA